jgi:hypothetical protein
MKGGQSHSISISNSVFGSVQPRRSHRGAGSDADGAFTRRATRRGLGTSRRAEWKIALWAKADSVTRFDRVDIKPLR